MITVSKDLEQLIGKDLEQLTAKLPADKEFVLVPKEEHIPKTRFDEVNTVAKDYKGKYEEVNKQFEALKPFAKDNEALNAKLKELQDINTKTVNDYEAKIAERDRNYSLNDTLRQYKPRNQKAVVALLDPSKFEFKDGVLKGATEQLEALRKSDPYLFEDVEPNPKPNPNPFAAGRKPGETQTDPNDPIAKWFGLDKTKK